MCDIAKWLTYDFMANKDTYYKQIKICHNNSNLSTKRLSHYFRVLIFVALFPNFTFSHQFQHVLSHQVMDPIIHTVFKLILVSCNDSCHICNA